MNLGPWSLQRVALCYTLLIIFLIYLEITYVLFKNLWNESTFIKTLNPKQTNLIVDCIYCHFHMDLNGINDYYIIDLLHKLSKESKTFFFLGGFNIIEL